MDVRQLSYAVAVADHGSFTRAARALRLSQPSLSHGVRALEDELGVELFVRLGRSVTPTSAGQHVIDAARQVVLDLANVRAAAAAVAHLQAGTIDIVTLPTLAVEPLADLIGTFRRRHPAVRVRVHEPEEAGGVEQQLRSGRAELGLTDIGVGGRGLTRIPLFRQRIMAVSPPGAWPEGGEPDALSAAELAQLPLVVTPPGTSTRRLLDRILSRHDLDAAIAVEINHREALVGLVLAGAGTCLLPQSLADQAAARGAVVRPLRPDVQRRIGLLHRTTPLSPAAAAMVTLAKALPPRRRAVVRPSAGTAVSASRG